MDTKLQFLGKYIYNFYFWISLAVFPRPYLNLPNVQNKFVAFEQKDRLFVASELDAIVRRNACSRKCNPVEMRETQQVMNLGRKVFLFLAAMLIFLTDLPLPTSLVSQVVAEENDEEAEKERKEMAREALGTLGNLLDSKAEQITVIENLKNELESAKEEASKKELEAKIKTEQDKLSQLEARLIALTTGVADDAFSDKSAKPFDLESELGALAEPFIKMMKSATSSARQIEQLRTTVSEATRQKELAGNAIERISQLQTHIKNEAADNDAEKLQKHLSELLSAWQKRNKEANDLAQTAEQQLELRLTEQDNAPSEVGQYATNFLRNRGFNIAMSLIAFFGVFSLCRFVANAVGSIGKRQGVKRNFAVRLTSLVFQIVSIIISLFAMMFVLNYFNDWILLGLTSVFAIALSWIGLKMLPALIEQTTLLLNLGAVQEDERVMLAGVPWRVENLGFHTDLVNPELEGGTFTLPVRELVGLHSRPAADNEAWFPTRKNDWVQLKDGRIGCVAIQTPELVQLIELGGARVTYSTADFISEAPRNLSTGYRVEVTFGLDYRHQSEATDEIPRKIREHVKRGIEVLLDGKGVRHVQAELIRAGDSSIDYEVEADIAGEFAHRYEDVEREIARLLVEACNINNWTIPFPQMVLHQK